MEIIEPTHKERNSDKLNRFEMCFRWNTELHCSLRSLQLPPTNSVMSCDYELFKLSSLLTWLVTNRKSLSIFFLEFSGAPR